MSSSAEVQSGTRPVRPPWIAKWAKYAAASMSGAVSSSLTLYVLLEIVDMGPVPANIIAVTVGAVPNYLVNRAWTFGKRGAHSFTREVLPFWGMALLGLIISTFAVAWAADRWEDNTLVVILANLASFGVLWVARFFILERVLFKPLAELIEEHEDAEGHLHLHTVADTERTAD
jgi:putative flippase GtrA